MGEWGHDASGRRDSLQTLWHVSDPVIGLVAIPLFCFWFLKSRRQKQHRHERASFEARETSQSQGLEDPPKSVMTKTGSITGFKNLPDISGGQVVSLPCAVSLRNTEFSGLQNSQAAGGIGAGSGAGTVSAGEPEAVIKSDIRMPPVLQEQYGPVRFREGMPTIKEDGNSTAGCSPSQTGSAARSPAGTSPPTARGERGPRSEGVSPRDGEVRVVRINLQRKGGEGWKESLQSQVCKILDVQTAHVGIAHVEGGERGAVADIVLIGDKSEVMSRPSYPRPSICAIVNHGYYWHLVVSQVVDLANSLLSACKFGRQPPPLGPGSVTATILHEQDADITTGTTECIAGKHSRPCTTRRRRLDDLFP